MIQKHVEHQFELRMNRFTYLLKVIEEQAQVFDGNTVAPFTELTDYHNSIQFASAKKSINIVNITL